MHDWQLRKSPLLAFQKFLSRKKHISPLFSCSRRKNIERLARFQYHDIPNMHTNSTRKTASTKQQKETTQAKRRLAAALVYCFRTCIGMIHHHRVSKSKENRGESKEFVSFFHYMNVQHWNYKVRVIYLESQYNYHYTYAYIFYKLNKNNIKNTHVCNTS